MVSNVLKNLVIAAWEAVCTAGKIELARSADISRDEPYFEDRSLEYLAQRADNVHMDVIRAQQYVESTEGGDVVVQPTFRYEATRTHEVRKRVGPNKWERVGPPMTGSIEQVRPHLHAYREEYPDETYKLFEINTSVSTTSSSLNF